MLTFPKAEQCHARSSQNEGERDGDPVSLVHALALSEAAKSGLLKKRFSFFVVESCGTPRA